MRTFLRREKSSKTLAKWLFELNTLFTHLMCSRTKGFEVAPAFFPNEI
jgi:hypothetical protein